MQVVLQNDRSVVWKTKALKKGDFSFALPKMTGTPSREASEMHSFAVSAVDNLDEGLYEMGEAILGHRIKPDQAKTIRAELEGKVHNVVGNGRNIIRQDRAKTAARRATLLAPPAVGPNNFVQALRDAELWAAARTYSAEQRTKLLAAIGSPAHRAALESWARNPDPLNPVGSAAREMYAGIMSVECAEALAVCDAEDEGAANVETCLNACEMVIK